MEAEFRRIFWELILPYLKQNKDEISKEVQAKIKRAAFNLSKEDTKTDDAQKSGTDSKKSLSLIAAEIIDEELAELEKDEVEQFDDYLEMIMTFGYITLFASAFPLGTTITSIFIYLETKSDLLKYERTARRPFSKKAHDIGNWEFVLDIFTVMSVFTNIVLCCYASNQIDYVLPWLKGLKENSLTNILTIFGIEHVMLLTVFFLRLMIMDTEPNWLRIFKERLSFKSIMR